MNTSPQQSAQRMNRPSDRRGNTLILVTAILVLLVIIATAYISRAQGVRAISNAQRNAVGRLDRAQTAANVVASEIAGGLFPKLINENIDPGAGLSSPDPVFAPVIATTATPRYRVDNGVDALGGTQPIDRHSVDPYWVDTSGNGRIDSARYPYNFAPYETRPWTNWPDAVGTDDALAEFLPGGRGNPGANGRV
ncbi:MAG: hypothetical protein MK085_06830, partial [Phycisphaerales bacterium]|nr:hypothetical protein [Phycisphaerales bacterium]